MTGNILLNAPISGNKELNKVLVSFEKKVPKEKLEQMRSSVTSPYGQVHKSEILLIIPAELRYVIGTG